MSDLKKRKIRTKRSQAIVLLKEILRDYDDAFGVYGNERDKEDLKKIIDLLIDSEGSY